LFNSIFLGNPFNYSRRSRGFEFLQRCDRGRAIRLFDLFEEPDEFFSSSWSEMHNASTKRREV
jgi:hypothetical protein